MMGPNERLPQAREFLGNANSIRMADAVLSEVVHESVRSIPVHRHEWPYVSMLLRGFYAETVGDTTMHCQPFSAVFHGAAMTHSDEIGEGGARFFIIELGESWAEIIERLGGRRQSFFELHGEGTSWPALRAYHAFIEGAQGEKNKKRALRNLRPPPEGAVAGRIIASSAFRGAGHSRARLFQAIQTPRTGR